jgi:hypothetical protein
MQELWGMLDTTIAIATWTQELWGMLDAFQCVWHNDGDMVCSVLSFFLVEILLLWTYVLLCIMMCWNLSDLQFNDVIVLCCFSPSSKLQIMLQFNDLTM